MPVCPLYNHRVQNMQQPSRHSGLNHSRPDLLSSLATISLHLKLTQTVNVSSPWRWRFSISANSNENSVETKFLLVDVSILYQPNICAGPICLLHWSGCWLAQCRSMRCLTFVNWRALIASAVWWRQNDGRSFLHCLKFVIQLVMTWCSSLTAGCGEARIS